MSERRRVIPDVAHEFPLNGNETIVVSGTYDHLYYYEPLNVHWLRFYDSDRMMKMVVLKEAAAEIIKAHTDVPRSERETIFEEEHKMLVTALGGWATDDMFEVGIDADAIEAEWQAEQDGTLDTPTNE